MEKQKRLAFLAAYIGAMPVLKSEDYQRQLVLDLEAINAMDEDDKSRLAHSVSANTTFVPRAK